MEVLAPSHTAIQAGLELSIGMTASDEVFYEF
jgi:hypothetical protein